MNAKSLSSDMPSRLVVLEGMPGAGKTTTIEALSNLGHDVVGEYVDESSGTLDHDEHPGVDDDDGHQLNWSRKADRCTQLLGAHPVVYVDRDWLSSLAYAYSVAPEDAGNLLSARAAWALTYLGEGRLLLANVYVIFDLDSASSLARRAGHLRSDHPWNRPDALDRLREFYVDPSRSLRPVSAELAERIGVPQRIDVSEHDRPLDVLRRLDSLAPQETR